MHKLRERVNNIDVERFYPALVCSTIGLVIMIVCAILHEFLPSAYNSAYGSLSMASAIIVGFGIGTTLNGKNTSKKSTFITKGLL